MIIKQFGGYENAFNKEDKTRHLVQHLLLYAIRDFPKLQMDMEINLKTFNNLRKPDIVILERNSGGEETNYIPSIGQNGKMFYIIEVKKFNEVIKNNQKPFAPFKN
jgi:hypothetical protein